MKKEIKEKKRFLRQKYQITFDLLMDIAIADETLPHKMLIMFDEVADYIGDIASGRKNKYTDKTALKK